MLITKLMDEELILSVDCFGLGPFCIFLKLIQSLEGSGKGIFEVFIIDFCTRVFVEKSRVLWCR